MEMAGIENIADIEMRVEVRDPDSYDLILDPVLSTIQTSVSGSYEQTLPEDGDVVLEQDGVKITYLGYDMDGFFWSGNVFLYRKQQ